MRIRLLDYDWIVINTSAGKDSQAMCDKLCKIANALGILDRVVFVHCDLCEEEWPETKELAEVHAKHYGVRFEVVKRKQGSILAHVLDRHAKQKAKGQDAPPWPSNGQRWCTSDHKRGQVSTLFTKLADETRRVKGKRYKTRILNCMGMRADESVARSKLLPFKLDRNNSGSVKKLKNGTKKFVFSSRRIVHIWLPIFDWSVGQVWDRVKGSGVPWHYAYDLGMPRLSCCFCIYAPRNALMLAGKHNRELLDRYCEVEEKVGYSFQHKLSLREVRDALDRGEEPGPIKTWEM